MSSIRTELGSQWRHIGYTLGLQDSKLNNIELNFPKVEERAFNMLKMWIEKDVEACYCKLISAMKEEGFVNEVETLKEKITASE